jgi:hypothetical protein
VKQDLCVYACFQQHSWYKLNISKIVLYFLELIPQENSSSHLLRIRSWLLLKPGTSANTLEMLMFTFVVQICLFSSVRQDTLSPKFANISCKTEAACHPGGGGGWCWGSWQVLPGCVIRLNQYLVLPIYLILKARSNNNQPTPAGINR